MDGTHRPAQPRRPVRRARPLPAGAHRALGHIHQEFDQQRGNLRLLASPSTCVQFAPGSEEFQVSSEAPGYRWLRLYADGTLDTGVSRVTGITFEIDYSVKGY